MDWKRILSPRPRLTPDLEEHIRRSFDEASRDEEHFPSTIDPRIYHVKLLLEHLGDLSGKKALDVGCGKGRFARVFLEQEPQAEIWGLDISEEMLKFVPAGIHTRAGTPPTPPNRSSTQSKSMSQLPRSAASSNPAAASPSSTKTPRISGNSKHRNGSAGSTAASSSVCLPDPAAKSAASSSPTGKTWSPTGCFWPGWQ